MQDHYSESFLPRIVAPNFQGIPYSLNSSSSENLRPFTVRRFDFCPPIASRRSSMTSPLESSSRIRRDMCSNPINGTHGKNYLQYLPQGSQFNFKNTNAAPRRVFQSVLRAARENDDHSQINKLRYSLKHERNVFEEPHQSSPNHLAPETASFNSSLDSHSKTETSRELDDDLECSFKQESNDYTGCPKQKLVLPKIETRFSSTCQPDVLIFPFEDDSRDISKSILKKDKNVKYSPIDSDQRSASDSSSASLGRSFLTQKASTFLTAAGKTKGVRFLADSH